MINRKQAQKKILKFANKYEGQEVIFKELNNRDKYNYILADTYINVELVIHDIEVALDRAIERAERLKKDKFKSFIEKYPDEKARFR